MSMPLRILEQYPNIFRESKNRGANDRVQGMTSIYLDYMKHEIRKQAKRHCFRYQVTKINHFLTVKNYPPLISRKITGANRQNKNFRTAKTIQI